MFKYYRHLILLFLVATQLAVGQTQSKPATDDEVTKALGKLVTLFGEGAKQCYFHMNIYGDTEKDSDPTFMKVVKDFEKTTGLYLHIGLFGQDNFKNDTYYPYFSKQFREIIFEPRNSKKGEPALILEFTLFKIADKEYAYKTTNSKVEKYKGDNSLTLKLSSGTKNDKLESLMPHASCQRNNG